MTIGVCPHLYYPNSHAEHRAILAATGGKIEKGCLKGYSIYVTRVRSNSALTMARPCENCARLIKFVGITKIVYTDWDGNVIHEKEIEAEEGEDPLLG